MSSWQSQIESLTGDGSVIAAAIYGNDGTIRATSADVSVKISEVQDLVKLFGEGKGAQGKEIYLEDTKYVVVNTQENVLQVQESAQGAICYHSKETVWIGFYDVGVEDVDKCISAIKLLADSTPAGNN